MEEVIDANTNIYWFFILCCIACYDFHKIRFKTKIKLQFSKKNRP